MARVAPLTDIDFTVDEMMKHVARFKEQKSTSKSFIDTQIPGHERDIFTSSEPASWKIPILSQASLRRTFTSR